MTLPKHGGQPHLLTPDVILDLSANINPEGPPPPVLEALRQALEDPTTLTAYPDLELRTLRQAISHHAQVPAESITLANGFVPLLEATLRARNIRRCLLPVPAFTEYRLTLERCNIEVLPIPLGAPYVSPLRGGLSQTADFHLPASLLPTLNRTHADAILLANPQNPSGQLTPAADLKLLAEHTTVLVDEAFIDYAPAESLTALAATCPNLTVFRSLTKFFAIPGLRVAYAVSHPDHARAATAQLPPWPITTLAALAIPAALADTGYQIRTRTLNQIRRTALVSSLEAIGIHPYDSAANFLLLPIPGEAEAGQLLWHGLLNDDKILLRNCANFESLTPNHLRTAIRTEPENARLITALTRRLP